MFLYSVKHSVIHQVLVKPVNVFVVNGLVQDLLQILEFSTFCDRSNLPDSWIISSTICYLEHCWFAVGWSKNGQGFVSQCSLILFTRSRVCLETLWTNREIWTASVRCVSVPFSQRAILAPSSGINTGVTNDPNWSSVQFRSGTVQAAGWVRTDALHVTTRGKKGNKKRALLHKVFKQPTVPKQ